MRRRDFINVIAASAATWPLSGRAQPVMPVVGYFSGRSPQTEAPLLAAVRRGFLLAATVVATPAFAKSNGSFGGSKGASSGPVQPRTTAKQPMIDPGKLKLRCYHTREPNSLGIYVHRTHCG